MRTVIAVCYPELEDYIFSLPYLEIVDVCANREELVKSCDEFKPEYVIISNILPGNTDMRQIITKLTDSKDSRESKLRITYIYGGDDGAAEVFCSFLDAKGVRSYYVGYNLTSIELESLINNAMGRSPINNSNIGSNSLFEKRNAGFLNRFKGIATIKKESGAASHIRSVINNLVITVYSAHVTGKSHTAWNLAYCLSRLNYKVSIINLDKGYSANIYYGIDEIYYNLLEYIIKNDSYCSIIDSCYKRKNLNVITGKLGNTESISKEEFLKLLYHVRTKSDITIIDTNTDINDVTSAAIENSSIDLFIFDSDLMHFNSNRQLIHQMGSDFIPEKTIAVINNCNKASESYKYIHNQIKKLRLDFRSILPVSSCGLIACDLMLTDKVPYQITDKQNEGFSRDFDKLVEALNIKQKHRTSRRLFLR